MHVNSFGKLRQDRSCAPARTTGFFPVCEALLLRSDCHLASAVPVRAISLRNAGNSTIRVPVPGRNWDTLAALASRTMGKTHNSRSLAQRTADIVSATDRAARNRE